MCNKNVIYLMMCPVKYCDRWKLMLDVVIEAMRATMVRMVASRRGGSLTLMPAMVAIKRVSVIAETTVVMMPVPFRLIHRLLMGIRVKSDMTTRLIP